MDSKSININYHNNRAASSLEHTHTRRRVEEGGAEEEDGEATLAL